MFLTHPELLVTRLLCAELEDTEAVLVHGAERFSRYAGYSRTLEFAGDFRDTTPCDANGIVRSSLAPFSLSLSTFPSVFFRAFPVVRFFWREKRGRWQHQQDARGTRESVRW